jgi:hypothetical protein
MRHSILKFLYLYLSFESFFYISTDNWASIFLQGMFMNKIVATAALALVVLASGCASITNESSTPLRFETFTQAGEEVKDMDCKVENDYGAQTVKTPGSLLVHRSSKDLQITCTKPGQADAKGAAISRANAGLAGNLIFGGGIGAIIDHNKGTAYTYPQWMRLVVDKLLTFDRREDKDGAPNLGTNALTAATTVKDESKAIRSANPGAGIPAARNTPSQSANVVAPAASPAPRPVAVPVVAPPVAVVAATPVMMAKPSTPLAPSPAPVAAAANGSPAKPDTSATNPVNDADKLPLSKEGRDEYRQWLTKPLPRAFAVAANGVWLAAWGTKPQNTALPTNPSERALQACQNRAKEACKLYAVDNEVVWGVK